MCQMKKRALIICTAKEEFCNSLPSLDVGLEFTVISTVDRKLRNIVRETNPDVVLIYVDRQMSIAWEKVCEEVSKVSVAPILCVCPGNGDGQYLDVAERVVNIPQNHAEMIAVVAELWRLAHRGSMLAILPIAAPTIGDAVDASQPQKSTLRFIEWTTLTATLFSLLAGAIAFTTTRDLERAGATAATAFAFITLVLTGKPIGRMTKAFFKNSDREPPS